MPSPRLSACVKVTAGSEDAAEALAVAAQDATLSPAAAESPTPTDNGDGTWTVCVEHDDPDDGLAAGGTSRTGPAHRLYMRCLSLLQQRLAFKLARPGLTTAARATAEAEFTTDKDTPITGIDDLASEAALQAKLDSIGGPRDWAGQG